MTRLSAVDAFFVAYQEAAGILMSVGAEARLVGQVTRAEVVAAVEGALATWPVLGCGLDQPVLGLRWVPRFSAAELVRDAAGALDLWRNEPIDPFHAPPFQVRFSAEGRHTHLAFRAHHAALDGQALFTVAAAVLRLLAAGHGGEAPPLVPVPTPPRALVGWRALLAGARLRDLLGFTRWLKREAKAGRSARLALAAVAPGPTGVCATQVVRARVEARAQTLGVSLATLGASAWVQAIHRFNRRRGGAKGPISLEIPVSFRPPGCTTPGNLISPITVFADPEQPFEALATGLHQRLRAALKRKLHHAVPLFSRPGAYLPWGLFRRVAVTPTSTGFATSHFTLVDTPGDLAGEVDRLSGGRLRLVEKAVWTPVCLAMGAAALLVPWGDHLQVTITHRRSGLDDAAAQELLDLLVEGLG